MTLFEIDAELRAFLDSLYDQSDEDGVVEDIDFDKLEGLQEERKHKLESVALYYKELQAEADAIDAEAKKMAERAKSAKARAESFKNYIALSMHKNGESEFSTSRCKLTFRKSKKVVIDNLEQIPNKYIITKTEHSADKKEIKKALDSGEQISGVHIEETDNIQIK